MVTPNEIITGLSEYDYHQFLLAEVKIDKILKESMRRVTEGITIKFTAEELSDKAYMLLVSRYFKGGWYILCSQDDWFNWTIKFTPKPEHL